MSQNNISPAWNNFIYTVGKHLKLDKVVNFLDKKLTKNQMPLPIVSKEKSFADKIYEAYRVQDTLYDKIVESISNYNPGYMLKQDWPLPVDDTWADHYDNSVELVMTNGIRLSSSNVKKILDLGFSKIYETYWDEDEEKYKGVLWYNSENFSECRPTGGAGESSPSYAVSSLRVKLQEALEKLEKYEI